MNADLRNRIVEHAEADPRELTPNPSNWRRHPDSQRRYVDGALREVGWVREPIVNRTSGRLVDGHLRVEQAIAAGEETVPVAYVELTEREEQIALATHDAITASAATDEDALIELLGETETEDAALRELLQDLAPEPGPPGDEDGEGADDEGEEAPTPMADRFLRPPFSIIDTRDEEWADREKQWEQAGVECGVGLEDSPALHEILVTWFAGADDTVHHIGAGGPGPRVAQSIGRGTEASSCDLIVAVPQERGDEWQAEIAEAAQALREDRFAVVLGPDMAKAGTAERPDERLKDVAAALGWRYYNEMVLIHEPEGNGKLPRAHRTAYVFVYGNPKAATEHIGPVQVADNSGSP